MFGSGMHNRVMPFFDKDEGGKGGTTEDATGDQKVEEKSADDTKDQKDQKGGKGEKEKAEEKLFSQKELDAHIADRLDRERKKNEAEAERARKQAEEDALTKNSEFQKLAETRAKTISDLEGQVKELTTFKENFGRYEGALKKYLEAAIKDVPKHVLPLIGKLDVVDALEYLAANAAELGVTAFGVPETPKEKGGPSKEQAEASRRAAANHTQRTF